MNSTREGEFFCESRIENSQEPEQTCSVDRADTGLPEQRHDCERLVPGKRDLHADCGAFCYKSLRHSLCHGWAGGAAAVLLRMVSGIEILEPGFRKIRIKPNCAGFDYFKCTIPTPQGVIRIAMKNGENPRIELPKGVSLSL